MNLEPWLERVKSRCPLLENRVFIAVELANTEPAELQTPCVFVVPLLERADDKSNVVGQKIIVQVAVVSVVRNVADARGSEAYIELDAVRESIKKALAGWQPETGKMSTVYLGGTMNYFDDLIVSWVDRFESFYYLKYEK